MDKQDTNDVVKTRIEQPMHTRAVAGIEFGRFVYDIFA